MKNGIPLSDSSPSGFRDSNGLYSEMDTAHAWGLTPAKWYACDRAERAMMIAHGIVKARIENAVNHGDK